MADCPCKIIFFPPPPSLFNGQSLIFFRLLLSNCLNWKIYCDDHSSLSSKTAVQKWIISYILHLKAYYHANGVWEQTPSGKLEFKSLDCKTVGFFLKIGPWQLAIHVVQNRPAGEQKSHWYKTNELLESMDLQQHVNEPTHESGHTLDLIITRQCDSLLANIPVTDCLFSDHSTLICDLTLGKPLQPKEKNFFQED